MQFAILSQLKAWGREGTWFRVTKELLKAKIHVTFSSAGPPYSLHIQISLETDLTKVVYSEITPKSEMQVPFVIFKTGLYDFFCTIMVSTS